MERTLPSVKTKSNKLRTRGINAALFSAFFLGLAPIFGKQAINLGFAPLGVVAVRTVLATVLLLGMMLAFQRKYLYIYPAGLLGCLLAGLINGLGSLFYYSALARIDAGVGQLLYSLYPLFVAFWMFFDSQPPTRITLVRLIIAVPAVYLLVQAGNGMLDPIGVAQMLIAAALYALHLPINQRVLFEMPAPTVTLYTLIGMSAVVAPSYLLFHDLRELAVPSAFWWPVIGLTLVTFFSRLTLFTGIKHLGGTQTALLGLGELLVTVALAQLWLGESLNPQQWLGGVLLSVSLLLVGLERGLPPRNRKGGWFSWLSAPVPAAPSEIGFGE